MAMTIAVMALMNHQNIVSQKAEHALVICSRVTTEIAFREFTSAVSFMNFNLKFIFKLFFSQTVTTIVWITAMKTTDINAVSCF